MKTKTFWMVGLLCLSPVLLNSNTAEAYWGQKKQQRSALDLTPRHHGGEHNRHVQSRSTTMSPAPAMRNPYMQKNKKRQHSGHRGSPFMSGAPLHGGINHRGGFFNRGPLKPFG